jgi:predicted O-methyltransferase YrrM
MLEARPDAKIYSIDMGECKGEFDNLKKAGLNIRRVTRVLGKSQDVGKMWDIMCDMLFIDGDHSEVGVTQDILLFRPWVRSGGIISFHDYIPDPIPPEIKGRAAYAIDKLMTEEYEEIMWIERLKAFRMP